MGNPYKADFLTPDGTTRLGGSINFTDPANQPGGSSPVTCQLFTGLIDASLAGNHALLWSALQDNPWDENTLLAIPAGLGMTFAFDGSDSTLTTTAAGTWALSLAILDGSADADWRGEYNDGLWGVSRVAGGFALMASAVYSLPAGAQLQPVIVTAAQAAIAQTFNGSNLLITRLA